MAGDLEGVVRELYERYPLLSVLALGSDIAEDGGGRVPPFLGILISMLEERETGASCALLPSRERIGFVLALVGALMKLRQSFEELELDRLTTPLRPGSLVRVAPVDRVFEVVEDGRESHGQRWTLLKNPADEQIHYIPEGEAFRLTPTTDPSPRPHKGMRPGNWTPAPIDKLLGIRTGGNLAVVPNRIVLVAPRGDTRELATATMLIDQSCEKTPTSELITWGRIGKEGRVISEDGLREPMIAVTHSVDLMAAACRGSEARKTMIVEGARALAGNLQAYDDAVAGHRLLILSDHSELPHVDALANRGCEVWAPTPETVLLGGDGASMKGWFSAAGSAARNCRRLSIIPVNATDPSVESLHDTIKDVESPGAGDESAVRLMGQAWLVLATVSGWLDAPSGATLEFFDRKIREIDAGLQRDRMWLAPEVTTGLHQFLEAATIVRESEDVGGSKREALLGILRSETDVGVVTRSAPGAARVRNLLTRVGFDAPVYPIPPPPEAHHSFLVSCSWPGRQSMSRLATRYVSPRIDVLTYPFENPWLSSFARRWSREWTRYARSADEVSRIIGISIPEDLVKPDPKPASPGHDNEDDPLTRILNRRRKGGDAGAVPEQDAREAHYVGFHGTGYCFLTEEHKVPVLTDLVVGGELPGDRVPIRPVRKLVAGDFLLFRDHGDQDVLVVIAEHELGITTYSQLRELAGRWRPALKSIGGDPFTIWRRLRDAGLRRKLLTVRAWLTDGERIGPRSEKDLRVIADASGHRQLSDDLERVSAAISAIRAAHIKAGFTLSKLLLRELPGKLPEIDESGGRVDFTFGGGWVVCIDEIAQAPEDRPHWEVNRLLFEDET